MRNVRHAISVVSLTANNGMSVKPMGFDNDTNHDHDSQKHDGHKHVFQKTI